MGGPSFALDSAGTIRALSLPAAPPADRPRRAPPSLCLSTARPATPADPLADPGDATAAIGAGPPETPPSHEESA